MRSLSSKVPDTLQYAIICGFCLYYTHRSEVYLYSSDREFDSSELGHLWYRGVKDIVSFYWVSGEDFIYYKLSAEGAQLLHLCCQV